MKEQKQPVICLLGSSSMQGFKESRLPGYTVYNRGVAADVLGIGSRGLSHRLECSVFDMNPDVVFIKNGRNDLGNRRRNGEPSIPRMIREYGEIIDEMKSRAPDMKIVVVTCAPTRGKYENLAGPTKKYNEALVELAKNKRVELLDLWSLLVEEDGVLLKEKYSGDGLHMSQAGYDVLEEKMLDFIKPLEKPDCVE